VSLPPLVCVVLLGSSVILELALPEVFYCNKPCCSSPLQASFGFSC
jgi:hypothetical protein